MSENTRRCNSRMLGEILAGQGRKGRWLAAQVGVSESSISRLMSGKQTVDEGVAKQIALILGSPFILLFEYADADELSANDVNQEAAVA